MEIRPLTADDLPFLRRMLDAAAFWRPMPTSPLPPRLRQLVLRPILRMLVRNYLGLYHRDWGRPGDVGVIAEMDGRPVGAAWYRLFTEASHGDGYIDDRTPRSSRSQSRTATGAGESAAPSCSESRNRHAPTDWSESASAWTPTTRPGSCTNPLHTGSWDPTIPKAGWCST